MTNAELNTALYEKMFAEQEQYKDWLLTQPPAKILDCSYEYTVRENFLMSLEYNSLTNDQAAALLVCPDVLKDLFHQYEKMGNSQMEEVWACFENRAEQVQAVQGQAKESSTGTVPPVGGNMVNRHHIVIPIRSTPSAKKPLKRRLALIIRKTGWTPKQRHRKFWTSLDPSGFRLSLLQQCRTRTGMSAFPVRIKRGPRRCPCRRAARVETGALTG